MKITENTPVDRGGEAKETSENTLGKGGLPSIVMLAEREDKYLFYVLDVTDVIYAKRYSWSDR